MSEERLAEEPMAESSSGWLQKLSGRGGLIGGIVIVFFLGILFGRCGAGGGGEEPGASEKAASGGEIGEDTVWTCSMHPEVRAEEPGQCPKCGMDLIPVESGTSAMSDNPRQVVLTERAKQLARIATVEVTARGGSARKLQLLGKIDYDETRVKTVTSWVDGRIDRLHVATTGQKIRKGQKVATFYSPEIYAAQSDLIQAARQLRRLEGASEVAKRSARASLESSRQRLRLLGVPKREVAAMQRAEELWKAIPIRTPIAGTVTERLVDEGEYVQEGSPLFKVADLSVLWVQLDAYESDLANLAVGQEVVLEVQALPGEQFEGKIAFIDPFVSPKTRTTRVRVEVENRDGLLRPGMFAEAVVRTEAPTDERLMIPETAPLFTGRRSVVFVEVPETERPTYELREVNLGPKAGEMYPVVSGLEAGERVVVRGAFVLDADLQLRGGASMMTMPDDPERSASGPVEGVSEEMKAELETLVSSYLALQEALAADDLPGARAQAAGIADAAGRAGEAAPEEVQEAWEPIGREISGHADHVGRAEDLTQAREGFASLSEQVVLLLRRFGNPTGEDLHLASCPMAFGEGESARWVQIGEEIHNAYRGEEMLTCGSIEHQVEPGGHLGHGAVSTERAAPAGGHSH